MDLKQLDYFVRVAELGSFTRAADQPFVPLQPIHLPPAGEIPYANDVVRW